MFTPTAFETGIMTRIAGPRERVKISVKKKKTIIWLLLDLLEKWLFYKFRRFWIVFNFLNFV